MEELQGQIALLIIECTGLEGVKPEDIDPQAPLFGDGLGLDSIDALEIGVALNKRFGVKLTAESEENRRHFANLASLAAFVAANRATVAG